MKTMYFLLLAAFIIVFWGVILNFLAKLIGLVGGFFNMVIVAFKYRKTQGFIEAFNSYNYHDALETDIFLHYNLRTLWNAILSKGGTPFGFLTSNHEDELVTLSSRLGQKSYEKKSLTHTGWFLYYFLFAIDWKNWKNGGHCRAAYNY